MTRDKALGRPLWLERSPAINNRDAADVALRKPPEG